MYRFVLSCCLEHRCLYENFVERDCNLLRSQTDLKKILTFRWFVFCLCPCQYFLIYDLFMDIVYFLCKINRRKYLPDPRIKNFVTSLIKPMWFRMRESFIFVSLTCNYKEISEYKFSQTENVMVTVFILVHCVQKTVCLRPLILIFFVRFKRFLGSSFLALVC